MFKYFLFNNYIYFIKFWALIYWRKETNEPYSFFYIAPSISDTG